MPDDPWLQLEIPHGVDAFTARRVNSRNPWGFFWATDVHVRCTLLLRHAQPPVAAGAMPRLRDIEVFDVPAGDSDERLLGLRLLSEVHREVFLQLCLDVVEWASRTSSEGEAVSKVLARTWRWHQLLRTGMEDRLTEEAQKGLIGELLALEEVVLPNAPLRAAVQSWVGPLDAPRDFELGGVALEAKARRADHPFVEITSEFQLDQSGSERLFLFVAEVDRALADTGVTLTDFAKGVYGRLASTDMSAAELFESKLLAAGFTWEQDYAGIEWRCGIRAIWAVLDGFPRIRGREVVEGVSHVRYAIALAHLDAYRATLADFSAAMKAGA